MSIRTSENAKKVIARVYSLFLKMYPQFSIRMATLVKSNRKKVLACEYFWGVRIKKKPMYVNILLAHYYCYHYIGLKIKQIQSSHMQKQVKVNTVRVIKFSK